MIYLCMFMLSSFFFYLGDRYRKKNRAFFDGIGITIPLLMATFRAETVGNDIIGYVKPMYLCAKNARGYCEYISALRSQLSTRDLERGFSFLGYIGTKLAGSICGVFFLDDLVMLIFVYLAVQKYNEIISEQYKLPQIKVSIAMFCYLTLFYNMSLTMMRQSLACSLILFCVVSLIAGQYMRSTISFVCAVTMHSTAVVSIVFVLLFVCIDRNWVKVRKSIIPIGLLFSALGGKMYWIIMNFLSKFIQIPGRYLTYEYMWNQGSGINLAFIYLIGCSFFCVWILKSKKTRNNNYLLILEYIVWFTVFLMPMSVAAANVSRVLYYFFYFFILLIPMTANTDIRIKMKCRAAIPITICMVFWMGTVLFNDSTGTLKYLLI